MSYASLLSPIHFDCHPGPCKEAMSNIICTRGHLTSLITTRRVDSSTDTDAPCFSSRSSPVGV